MINYSLILSINFSTDAWTMLDNNYETLQWFSNTPKPTQKELDALWTSTEETVAKNNCKNKAISILQSTDWTSIADVGDPTKANPYLINQNEFIIYRNTIRGYAVNPVVDPVWPTAPTEQWSS
jgi:hypothetical protein